jgi:hypothetical protein
VNLPLTSVGYDFQRRETAIAADYRELEFSSLT